MKKQKISHDSVPASVGLVKEVRDELRAEIRSVDHKVESLRHELKAEICEVKGSVEQVLVAVHRTQVLMEEQRGENRIVLDGLKTVIDRQERFERELTLLR
jgi:hypothetical protein